MCDIYTAGARSAFVVCSGNTVLSRSQKRVCDIHTAGTRSAFIICSGNTVLSRSQKRVCDIYTAGIRLAVGFAGVCNVFGRPQMVSLWYSHSGDSIVVHDL